MAVLPLLGGCVDSFRTKRPYPGSVHEPGFWRDLSGMESAAARRESTAPAARQPATVRRARVVTVTPTPTPTPQPIVIDGPPPSIEEIPLPRTTSLAGLSTRLDDVLRRLDELVEESMRVQESLLRLRLTGTKDRGDDSQTEPDEEDDGAGSGT